MRQPVNNQELQFDESGTHVKYALDGMEIFTLRLVLDFARHNLPQFIAKYREVTGIVDDPSAMRDELEELSQLTRDARYLLLLPLTSELAAYQMTNPKVSAVAAELRANAQKKA
jgi:hypothetical protein